MHPSIHAAKTPDKPAIVMAGTGEVVRYGELDRRSNQGAHLLRSLGLATGDTVAIMMTNDARFMEIVWAAQRAGLYYVGLSTKLTTDELAYILGDSGARLLIHSPSLGAVARAAGKAQDVSCIGCGGETPAAFEDRRAVFPDTPIADEAPGQDMLYSSGTTGRPKGIRFAPRTGGIDEPNTVTNLARQLYGFGPDTVFLSPAPLYHAAPLRFVMAAHQCGGVVVLMERFDAEGALAAIERHRVTHAQFVPTHFVRMLKLPDDVRERYDHSSLQAVFHAAAPCPIEVKRAMIDWWGPIIHEYYSSTETIGFTAVGPHEWLERPGTVGRSKMGEIHICDEAGNPVQPRTEGIIHFSGGMPLTYHNDPEKTAAAHNAHGWASVGDIGWVDEDGYLYLTDRKSFMIISGGVNIYPQEIENVLITHPSVADVAVIGVPDEEIGERVVAVVQPVDMARAGAALTDDLLTYLRARISGVKMPRRIDYRTELPRTDTGKLFKRLLRDEYRAGA